MATSLRAFISLLKDTNPWSEDHPRLHHEESFFPSGSHLYKMYKRAFHHAAADETSSEVTLDCSFFSEHDYDSEHDFGVSVILRDGKGHEDYCTEVMTLSPPLSVSAQESSSPFFFSSNGTPCPRSYSSINHQDWQTCTSADEAILLQELADRASSLLQRESSEDYTIKNCFQLFGCSPRFPPTSSSSFPAAPSSSATLPVDSKCRSIMMNWSFRVAEFALLNYEGQQRAQMKARLLSRTFSYVDRICSKFEIANRDQYKLLTIVCLHLAAKVSGLLKSDAQEYDCYERCQLRSSNDTASESASSIRSSTPSTSSERMSVADRSTNDSSIAVESHRTIVPTPHSPQGSSLPLQEDEEQDETRQSCSTEYIWLLSLNGLHSLCNDEFTFDEFKQMEYTVLHHGLGWRLSSVVALDWVDIYLELMTVVPPPLLLHCNNGKKNAYGKNNFISFTQEECDNIRDATLTQLEYAMKRPSLMTCAPSLVGLAAFLNVMKGYCSIGSDDCDLVLLSSIEEAIGVSIDYDDLYDLQVKMFEVDDDDYLV